MAQYQPPRQGGPPGLPPSGFIPRIAPRSKPQRFRSGQPPRIAPLSKPQRFPSGQPPPPPPPGGGPTRPPISSSAKQSVTRSAYIVSRKAHAAMEQENDAVSELEIFQISMDQKEIQKALEETAPFSFWDSTLRYGQELTSTQDALVTEFMAHLNKVEMDIGFEWSLITTCSAKPFKNDDSATSSRLYDNSVAICTERAPRKTRPPRLPRELSILTPLEESLAESSSNQDTNRKMITDRASRTQSPYAPRQSSWSWIKSSTDPTVKSNADSIAIHVVECWLYEGDRLPFIAKHSLKDPIVKDWLQRASPKSDDGTPFAGLKLIERQQVQAPTIIPFDEESFTAIHDIFGLPPVHDHLMSKTSGFLGRVSGVHGEIVFICKRPAVAATISAVISYEPDANVTSGYMLSGDGLPSVIGVLDSLTAQFAEYSHPILTFVLILEFMVENMASNLSSVEESLMHIERRTGYSNHKIMQPVDPSQLDYRRLAEDLGVQTCRFALIQSLIQDAMMLQEFIQEQLTSTSYLPQSCVNRLQPACDRLMERSKLTTSTLKHLEIYGGVEKRLQAQQNVIFNLIAQQDNTLNVEIARDSAELAAASKRDSSAMKIIAFLTTIFLPGTFISSFFAMPLFDWGAQSSRGIVTPHFWVYWAVTIPLTLLTIVIIAFWIRVQERKKEAISQAARGNFDDKSNSSESSYVVVWSTRVRRVWRRLQSLPSIFLKKFGYDSSSSSSRSLVDD